MRKRSWAKFENGIHFIGTLLAPLLSIHSRIGIHMYLKPGWCNLSYFAVESTHRSDVGTHKGPWSRASPLALQSRNAFIFSALHVYCLISGGYGSGNCNLRTYVLNCAVAMFQFGQGINSVNILKFVWSFYSRPCVYKRWTKVPNLNIIFSNFIYCSKSSNR